MQMNALSLAPSARQNTLRCPQETLPSMQFGPNMEMRYYSQQQESTDQRPARPSDPHAFSQPPRSIQAPHMLSRGFQSNVHHGSSFERHPPPNILPYSALYVGLPAVNLRHDRQALNTTHHRSYKDLHSMQNLYDAAPHFSFPPVQNNANDASETRHCIYNSTSPWQHQNGVQASHQAVAQLQPTGFSAQVGQSALSDNGTRGQMSVVAQHDEAHATAASRIPPDSGVSSQFRTSSGQMGQSRVQNAAHRPSPCGKTTADFRLGHGSLQTPHLPHRATLSSMVQKQPNQSLNQVSPGSSQDKPQSQTMATSGHQSTTNSAIFSSIQGGTQQRYQSQNTGSEQTVNSQYVTSVTTSMNKTSPPISDPRCNKYFHSNLLHHLLLGDNSQLTASSTFTKCFRSKVAKSKPGHIATRENCTQHQGRRGEEHQEPAKETDISTGNEIQTGWKKRTKELQSCREPAHSQHLEKSPLRMVRQVNKAVAVVPPISQQTSVHGQQNDMTTSTRDSISMETDTVKCLSKEKETNVPNMTWKLTTDLPGVTCSAGSSLLLGTARDSWVYIPEMASSENVHTSGSQSCERGPVSTTQITNQMQDPIGVVDSTSISPAEQINKQEVEISSEKTEFDLSTVPGVEYTLKELMDLVNALEIKSKKMVKSMRANTLKCIIDLYFDGDKKNLSKLSSVSRIAKPLSEFSMKEMHGVVLQYPEPEHVQVMKKCSQIIPNETPISEDFTSSWLNVDGQPADVETVLAEPMSEYNITWCKSVAQSVCESSVHGSDSLAQLGTDNAEDQGVDASKGIRKPPEDSIPDDTCTSLPEGSVARFATTDCNSDIMGLKKGAKQTPKKFSKMQRKSKKRYNQKPEDEVAMVTESMLELSEPSSTGSSDKCGTNSSDVLDKTDGFDDADSSDDFPDITVLSSEDAIKLFNEYSEDNQKRDSHQVYQEEGKDLVTLCVKNQSDSTHMKQSDDFKFTCPHVTGLDSGGASFCLTCWNETPLLDIDQDETLLTPKEGEITADSQSQSRSPLSRKPIKHQSAPVLKSRSIINSEDLQIITCSAGTQIEYLKGCEENADSPITSKTLTVLVSPPRNMLREADGLPEEHDLQVSPDNVIKNTNTHKQHPRDHRSTSSGNGECGNKMKKSVSCSIKKKCFVQLPPKTGPSSCFQLSNIQKTPEHKTAAPQQLKRPIMEEKRHDFKSKEAKKVRLELYGSNSNNSNSCGQKKSYTTPLYLTVSPGPNTAKSFTDETSAEPKVHSQCRTTSIHRKKISSSHKKRQKNLENELKSKIQILKKLLKERIMSVARKQSSESLRWDQAEEDAGADDAQAAG